MTSPLDTTLHRRATSPQPPRLRLIAACVAGRPVLASRSVALPVGKHELGRAVGPEGLGLETDPHVSRRHAVVEVDRAGVAKVSGLGEAVLEINGVCVGSGELRDGDVILLGESALVLRAGRSEPEGSAVEGIVGDSPPMRAVRRSIAKVGPAPVTVLLLGESGVGKELTARALHAASGRTGPFVALNCAAIPATLAEAQLFGHVAGAFTGAQKARPGMFRAAAGGTLFLDELGDLPLELQPKLLRALEERAVVPLGATESEPIDVRVVAATNRDLVADVEAGRFRGDLYARLAEFTIELPPLRERREDVLAILAAHLPDPAPELPFELTRALLLHPWPFNAREVRTVAAQIRMASEGGLDPLALAAIVERLERSARLGPREQAGADREPTEARGSGRPPAPTRGELVAMLRAHRGNITELARAAGRSRKQVYRWLEAHAVDAEQFRRG